MRISSLKVEGFRSLRSLHLDKLGTMNIFYGRNGAGKSNILLAIDRAFQVLSELFRTPGWDGPVRALSRKDLHHGEGRIGLEIQINGSGEPLLRFEEGWSLPTMRFALEVWETGGALLRGRLQGLSFPISSGACVNVDWDVWNSQRRPWSEELAAAGLSEGAPDLLTFRSRLTRLIQERLRRDAWLLVPATRQISLDQGATAVPDQASHRLQVQALLTQGRFAEAMVTASSSPDLSVREGFRRLIALMQEPPLSRPRLEPVHDRVEGHYDLQEVSKGRDGGLHAVSVGDQGLGVQQLYVVLGCLLLGGTAVAGLEEPEAHLHAPSAGRELRLLLRRVVELGFVRQLFVATHSNLFDLNLDGWYDVALEDGQTQVTWRADWAEMDRRHLYEPGPARHALMDLLRYLPEDTPVFRRPDGRPVSGPEMVRMLIDDDPVAFAFLDDVNAAAVRAVQLRSGP